MKKYEKMEPRHFIVVFFIVIVAFIVQKIVQFFRIPEPLNVYLIFNESRNFLVET